MEGLTNSSHLAAPQAQRQQQQQQQQQILHVHVKTTAPASTFATVAPALVEGDSSAGGAAKVSIAPSPSNLPIRATQFALAPHAVTTTVVTTTTTKITEFPPLLLDRTAPNSKQFLKPLNIHDFPLANTPTPPALKRLCFDINGVPTRLSELDLYDTDLAKFNSKHVAINTDYSASVTSPNSLTQNHFQQHAQSVTAFSPGKIQALSGHLSNNIFDRVQTISPHKNLRKREHRGTTLSNHHAVQHHTTPQLNDDRDIIASTADILAQPSLPSIPLTPFPDPSLTVSVNNLPVPLIVPLPMQPDFTGGLVNDETSANLPPSPTMSPTHASPPPFIFQNYNHGNQTQFHRSAATSPTSRRSTTTAPSINSTIAATATASSSSSSSTVFSAAAATSASKATEIQQIPEPFLSIPSMIHAYDAFPPELQSYMLLNLLRRTPSRTLQFVSALVLPALKRDFLTDLPAELAYAVLARLDLRALARCARVCRGWRRVVDGEGAEIAVWKQRLVREGWLSMAEIAGVLERWVMWRRREAREREAAAAVEGSGCAGISNKDEAGWSMAGEKKGKGKEVGDDDCTVGCGAGKKGKLRIHTGVTRVDLSGLGGRGVRGQSGIGLGIGGSGSNSIGIVIPTATVTTATASANIFGAGTSSSGAIAVDDDFSEDGGAYDYDDDENSESDENSGPFYEFAEDAEEDDENSSSPVGDFGSVSTTIVAGGSAEFAEYFSANTSVAPPHKIVEKTAAWMKSLHEFATGLSENEVSIQRENGAFRRGTANRMKISPVRERLRAYIQSLSKSELSRLALQIPNLYKGIYRRHHIVRRNWAKGQHNTIEFPGEFSDDQSIHIYDTKTGRLRRKLIGHDGGVWALQYWGDSLVSGSTDRTVRVWDMDTGLCTHLFEGHTSTVRCLMIVPPSETTEYPFGTNGKSGGAGFHAGMEPSQPLIVTGSRDASLRVWRLPNPKSGSYHVPAGAAGSVNPLARSNTYNSPNPHFLHVLNGHTNSVRAIAGHGRVLVSGSYDCTVRVWDLIEGECVYTFRGHREKVYSVGYSHELSRAVSGSLDTTVKVWCTRTGVLLHNLEGHTSLVGLLELSSSYLVSAAADHSLRIWAPDSGACLAHLHGHPAAITCFHHDPKLNRIVSGSDGGVKLWELSSAEAGGANAPGGPGFEVRQGPNGPLPVHGRFTRDLVTDITGVWRVRMDERRLVCAVSKEGGSAWFRVLDFGESAEYGKFSEGLGDGGIGAWEEDEDENDDEEEELVMEEGADEVVGAGNAGEHMLVENNTGTAAGNFALGYHQLQQQQQPQQQHLPPIFSQNHQISFGGTQGTHYYNHIHNHSNHAGLMLPPPAPQTMHAHSMPRRRGSDSMLFSGSSSSSMLPPTSNSSNSRLPESWNADEFSGFRRNYAFGANSGSSSSGSVRGRASLQEIVDDVDQEEADQHPPDAPQPEEQE
ncbi:SCF ubiquitin ligase complex subunit cdc4 [Physocladia obscura]|uniref:SCF ubiquitin ligase complex subunit cdc4 n=1 Tax=Physocladia obscura TaxID=109957 RepID=A0AAD5XHP3_9FUNG|nr:SCF ubiquitin ligase complex subunit cdc4 [Physocladia obscura]